MPPATTAPPKDNPPLSSLAEKLVNAFTAWQNDPHSSAALRSYREALDAVQSSQWTPNQQAVLQVLLPPCDAYGIPLAVAAQTPPLVSLSVLRALEAAAADDEEE